MGFKELLNEGPNNLLTSDFTGKRFENTPVFKIGMKSYGIVGLTKLIEKSK